MSFTATPVDGSSTPIPMSSAVPDGTNTPLAVEAGPSKVTGGNTLAPVAVYQYDGYDVTQGTQADAAVITPASSASVIALLKGLLTELIDIEAQTTLTPTVSGSVSVSNFPGTQPVSAASLPLPAGAALEAGHLATIDTSTAASKTDLDSILTNTNALKDTQVTGTVTNLNDAVSIALPGGQATALVNILYGTLLGTLNFEASPDSGTTWLSVQGSQVGSSSLVSSVTTPGAWRIGVAGFTNFRLRLGPVTSGTSGTLTIRLTQGVFNVFVNNATVLGQQAMNLSAPVVIASDQSPVKVTPQAGAAISGTLQNNVAVNGPGVPLAILGMGSAAFTVNMNAFTGTVTFQGSEDGTNFSNLSVMQLGTSTISTAVTGATTTAITEYAASVGGLQTIQAVVSGFAAGHVTVTAHAIPATFSSPTSGGGGGGTVTQGPGAAAGTNWRTAGDFTEIIGQGTGVVNAINTDLFPATDVSAFKWLSLQIAGTFSGTLTFQCSNDNVNFVPVLLSRVDAAGQNTTSAGAALYIGPVTFRWFRVRMTSFVSNTSLAGTLELYTAPTSLSALPVAATQAGTWTMQLISAVSQGTSDYHLISLASTNAGFIKASLGQVYGYEIYNTNAAARYVKLFNKGSAPTLGTDTPFRTIGVPPSGRVSYNSSTGIAFGTGIAIATTTGIADLDTTAVGAGDLSIDIDWK